MLFFRVRRCALPAACLSALRNYAIAETRQKERVQEGT